MDKVVVYSGNRKVYSDMVTAAKSMLYHTNIDRVYFLTEDDKSKFPEEIPSWFNVINVRDQHYISNLSPNFATPLSYMVLLRAAYHKIFKEDVVLQIDIASIRLFRMMFLTCGMFR